MRLFEVCVAKTYYYYTSIRAESVEDAEEKILVSDMNLEGQIMYWIMMSVKYGM